MRFPALILVFIALSLNIFAQAPAVHGGASGESGSAAFFPLSQLKEGMKGRARTVFHGSEP
ncbi:MAG: hypothetical protein ABJB34_02940, partial [Acidobacteriota bacterium]